MIKLKTPNSMEIAGQPAVITYVPELNAFRGKFLKLRVLSRMRVQKRLRPLHYAIQNR